MAIFTQHLTGNFGDKIYIFIHTYFGYISYLLPIPIFIGTFFLYKEQNFSRRRTEIIMATILMIFGVVMTQELLFEKVSFLGYVIYGAIIPIGGIAGFIILNTLVILLSLHMYFDLSIKLFTTIYGKFKNKLLVSEYQKKQEVIKNESTPKYQQLDEVIEEKKEEIKEELAETMIGIDHGKEIEEYLENKKKEILQVDTSVIEDSNVKRKINLLLTENIQTKEEESIEQEPIVNEVEEIKAILDDIEEESITPKHSTSVEIVKELEENKKLLDEIDKGGLEKPKDFQLPPVDFLAKSAGTKKDLNEAEIDEKIVNLLEKLKVFKIDGDVVRTYAGPVVTTFEFRPAPNVKVSKILGLEDDIAMALKAQTIRIQAPIPGKDVVGIEIPNVEVETIYLRELIENEIFQKASSPLTMILGKDIVGNPFITDLRKLPHLLIAGTTGSGKSVGINAMIISLLYRNSPDKLKFLMIDPKMLEFSIYNEIPHLLTPVITQPKQAILAMSNMVVEMDRRYGLMARTKTKSLESYNEKAKQEGDEEMPFIVVVIDELADLMMQGGKDVEISIARLAQKARACGIHLIIATQRPSTDVITGLIKANLPSRLSYRVGSKIDSKVILDQMGAHALLGKGDLLFTPPGSPGLVRLHAPWSTEVEIDNIVEFLKAQREADYDHSFLAEEGESNNSEPLDFNGQLDELYEDAKEIVISEKKTSISYIQRKLGIGYNRSANIIEQLEMKGVLSQANSKGQREVIGG